MKDEILKYNQEWVVVHDRLRRIAPDYPEIHREQIGQSLYFATWVPFHYCGKKYKRIHLESAVISKTYTEERLKTRLEHQIAITKDAAIPCWLDQTITIIDK